MKNSEIKEKIAEGHIHFNAIIEMVGKPKEHIQNTIKDYVSRIESHPEYTITKKDISRAKKTDDGFFSTFAELEVLVKDIHGVFAFCFNIMPASVEIIEPSELMMDNVAATDIVNELMAKLHEVDMIAKGANQKIANISQNFNGLTSNFIKFACNLKPRKIEEISDITGLPTKALIPLMDLLVKDKKLKKEGELYKI
ncbi:hypothetical protein C0585_07345 [Candidatus Woesearchaeota archaeon]|nr:MAG: hypothetical protein C0585_07345 [Candidatus Woesearchaeota archaeon]